MSERDQAPQVEYDSPVAEYSEDASSAIGQVPETASSLALESSHNASTQEVSTDSSQVGPVLESSMDSVTSAVSTGTAKHAPHTESEDQSQDADEEDMGSEDESEDEEDESEEDGDEEEPVLKYEKIGKDAADKFEKDAASAIAVGPSYFAVGTHNGLVYLFSLNGTLLRRYRPHSATITDIAISSSLSEPPPPTPTVAFPQPALPSFSLFPTSSPGTPRAATPLDGVKPSQSQAKTATQETPLVISDVIATASLDGQAILHSLATGTTTGHNFKRPLRTIALEPTYSNSSNKAYVCGGLAGELVLTSKSHLSLGGLENVFGGLGFGVGGGSQTQKVLHSGEGPIWVARWDGDIVAWANDVGVRLYSVSRGERLAFIDRPKDSPRADLFQCSLRWVGDLRAGPATSVPTTFDDEQQLIIGWADLVKVVRVYSRPRAAPQGANKEATGSLGAAGLGAVTPAAQIGGLETVVEVTKVLRLDCMIAGAMPWPFDDISEEKHEGEGSGGEGTNVPAISTSVSAPTAGSTSSAHQEPPVRHSRASSFLLLSYRPPKGLLASESTASRADQRRPNSNPPELQIVTSNGDERSSDVLAMKGYERWGCTDYRIAESFMPRPSPNIANEKAKLRSSNPKRLRERDHGGWLVMSPNGVVWVRKRDRMDRVTWLVEREKYEEALAEMDRMEKEGDYLKSASADGEVQVMSKDEISRMYLSHLFKEKQYEKAAKLCPRVLAGDGTAWEDWIFHFRYAEQLSVLVPYIPFQTPRLSKVAYGVVLDYYLRHDAPALSRAIKEWPSEIYDIPALINAIPQPPPTTMLMECLADLYIKNRQPGKALPYFLRLRRPNVFQLIRDNHLFTDVQDQALLLVEFDQELLKQREHLKASQTAEGPTRANIAATQSKASSPLPKGGHRRAATDSVGGSGAGGLFQTLFSAAVPIGVFGGGSAKPSASAPPKPTTTQPDRPTLGAHTHSSAWTSTAPGDATDEAYVVARGEAIPLLVEYSHSIPIQKVVSQLGERPYFLFLYLDALFDKDPELISDYLERQVALYAEYRKGRVIRLLQSAQNLQIMLPFERIYKICEDKDMVPEMVWVRSRMGDNKGALFLIIDRLGDVSRAIDFAKERKDDDLWEDLLRYSESRPAFIKGLLENVSTEIDSDPVRIIRRIRNGLEIPGLKQSIIKILQDLNLQTSLMEGCGNVLQSDCEYLGRRLQRAQAGGLVGLATGVCPICSKPLHQASQGLVLAFLCGHVVHAHCTDGGAGLPKQADSSLVGIGLGVERDIGAKLAYAEMVKRRLEHGCPVHQKLEQGESSVLQPPGLQSHHSHRHN